MININEQLPMEPTILMTRPAFLDDWILNSIEIDTEVTTRLTGDASLYEAYREVCREQKQPPPMSLRAFTKRLEALLEFHFKLPSTKMRDQKGMLFPAVKLKSANSVRSSRFARSERR